jgi:hypothetical protein
MVLKNASYGGDQMTTPQDGTNSRTATDGQETTPEADNDSDMYRTLDVISELCWETHQAWERIISEPELSCWEELTDVERARVIDSVKWFIDHPSATLSAEHDAWRARKILQNPDHTNLVPYDELPFSQQVKLRLWRHTMLAVIG